MNDAATFVRSSTEAQQGTDGLGVRSIAKSYDRRAVLHDVSLDVHRGEVVGLLGPNGAGKTTCFYSVMGLVKPDSGRIFLDGQDITDCRCIAAQSLALAIFRRKRRSFAAFRLKTISWPCWRSTSPTNVGAPRPARIIAWRVRPHCASRVSGNVAVGRRASALRDCASARCGAFDHVARRAFRRHRSDFHFGHPRPGEGAEAARIGVLITDHNVRETLDIVDRACIIYDGQVLFQGTPEALVADQEVRRLYLGESFAL